MIGFTQANVFLNNTLAKLVAAIVILLLGLLFGRFLSKLLSKILKEINLNLFLKDELKVNFPAEEFISRVVMYIIYFTALILALNQIGLTTTVLYTILITILVIIVILTALAFKDFVPNITAGFYIHHREHLKKGDNISVDNVKGKILDINLIETRIKTKEGDEVLVPNSLLLRNKVEVRK